LLLVKMVEGKKKKMVEELVDSWSWAWFESNKKPYHYDYL
jgi:hypothetical protein